MQQEETGAEAGMMMVWQPVTANFIIKGARGENTVPERYQIYVNAFVKLI